MAKISRYEKIVEHWIMCLSLLSIVVSFGLGLITASSVYLCFKECSYNDFCVFVRFVVSISSFVLVTWLTSEILWYLIDP